MFQKAVKVRGFLPKTLLLVGFRIDISCRQKNKVMTATYKEYVESVEQKNCSQFMLHAARALNILITLKS
jgi:hypothetical protein